MPEMGFITFDSYDPRYHFTARLGDGTAVPTGGYSGWKAKARPRRRGLTQWDGNDPLSIDIPIIFDNFAEGKSVEPEIRQLEKMAGAEEDITEPPLVIFDSNGAVPHDFHDKWNMDWVIADIKWGDADRNIHGNRIRQAATVSVMQYIADDAYDTKISSAEKHRKRKKGKTRDRPSRKKSLKKTYTVKRGDTLSSIAARVLGDSKKWRDIANKNNIRDPKNLKIGQVLKLP